MFFSFISSLIFEWVTVECTKGCLGNDVLDGMQSNILYWFEE